MAATPESKVKAKVKKVLEKYGTNAYYAMPVGGMFGKAGVPDFLICFYGKFVGIECKAGKNTTTALQDSHIKKINLAGGLVFVVNETSVDRLPEILEQLLINRSSET